MDEVLANLLGSIPRGEELHDVREGEHPDAKLVDALLVPNTSDKLPPYAIQKVYQGLVDVDGKAFELKDKVNIPESNSDDWVKRMFLADLHDMGIVPREQKQAIFTETDEHREAVLAAYQSKVDTNYPLRVVTDKNGYIRVRVIRKKRA